MPKRPRLVNDANRMLRFLRAQGLLGDEHQLIVSLLKDMCRRLEDTESAGQAAQISHEIRSTLALLPKPAEKPKPSAARDFMAELAALEESVQS